MMWRILDEFRQACRLLLKAPVFSIVSLLTIALGSGATVAIFTVVKATILAPVPFEEPESIVRVAWSNKARRTISVSPTDLHDWREHSESFETLAAYHPWSYTLTGKQDAERLVGAVVTADLFDLLRVEPSLGRDFDTDGPDAPDVVILSDAFWKRRFGADAGVLGSKVVLDDKPYEVIGVMPAGFRFPLAQPAELWVVSPYGPTELPRDLRFLRVLGRLADGVSLSAADSEMATLAARYAEQYPDANENLSASVISLHELLVEGFRQSLSYLQIAVLLALTIACFNVAILQLARGAARRGEFALRFALGGSRWRLLRQLLIENLVLGLAGGALGLGVAYGAVRLLVRFGPRDIYRLEQSVIDGGVLAFALAVALFSCLLFGLAPSIAASRAKLGPILSQSGRTSTRSGWARDLFVYLQVAITVVLLVGAGLMIQSLGRLSAVAPGFRTDHLLTMKITLPESKATVEQISVFDRELKERVESLPGAEAFATSLYLPLGGGMNVSNDFVIEGGDTASPDLDRNAKIRPVSVDFFTTMEIPLAAGRTFTEFDHAEAPGVAVINETMARLFWGAPTEAVGKRLGLQVDLGSDVGSLSHESWEIIGVAGDIKHRALDEATQPEIYFSTLQGPWRDKYLIVRTSVDPASLAQEVTAQVQAMDPGMPVVQVRTMDEIGSGSLSQPRFSTCLLSLFAVFALVLTVLGLYGVVSYSAHQRTREIGLRMALGADRWNVLGMVIRRTATAFIAGLASGLIGAFLLTRLLAGMLFEISTTDPPTFAAAGITLALVAFVASFLPALRAASLDPMDTLRYE